MALDQIESEEHMGKVTTAARESSTIIEAARALGSGAKTKAGARRFMLDRISATIPLPQQGRLRRWGHGWPNMAREEYRKRTRARRITARVSELERGSYLSRVRRFNALHPRLQAAIEERVGEPFAERSRKDVLGLLHRGQVPFSSLSPSHGYAEIGGWAIWLEESRTLDWEYYSKGWHSSHGPKVTVEDRAVVFARLHQGKPDIRRVKLSAWRGDYIARAALEAEIVEKRRGKMRLRLSPAYDLEVVQSVMGATLYRRTLLGTPVDYVLEQDGDTFHAESRAACFAGMKRKRDATREAARRETREVLDYTFARSLGFCDAGIQQFAEDFGLKVDESYSPRAIRELAEKNPDLKRKYEREIKALLQ